MSFLRDLFPKNNKYQSIYPHLGSDLSSRQKSIFDLIATQYKRITYKNPSGADLEQAFFGRFNRAKREGMDLNIFLQAEEEALHIYKKKMLNVPENLDSKSQDSTPLNQEQISFNDSLSENYPKIHIHDKASLKLERLLGGLIEYEKKFSRGLVQSTKITTESEYQQIVYEVIYGLEDFTHFKGKAFPFIFSQYYFDLDKEERSHEQLENEILTKISIIFDNIKKITTWSKRVIKEDISNNPFFYFYVEKKRLNYRDFFYLLEIETNKFIDAFSLHSLDQS